MKILLLAIGKTDAAYLREGFDIYEKRLKHYVPFEFRIIPDLKNTKSLNPEQQKIQEGKLILKEINDSDDIVLLDEGGKEFSSTGFADLIQKKMLGGARQLFFIIGGPYGFSDEVKERAGSKLSLSKMTFSHQMVRLIFAEQLYRAMTIHKGEPYHHE